MLCSTSNREPATHTCPELRNIPLTAAAMGHSRFPRPASETGQRHGIRPDKAHRKVRMRVSRASRPAASRTAEEGRATGFFCIPESGVYESEKHSAVTICRFHRPPYVPDRSAQGIARIDCRSLPGSSSFEPGRATHRPGSRPAYDRS